ncbi:MAG: PQQ-binding-like beta-propeller repeat protein [Planctomycetes bacterium]|nr:PQQ-binding-like beta-propeller repeat protein [Planctomycetota bacterium]
MLRRLVILLVAAVAFCPAFASGQPTPLWQRVYNGPENHSDNPVAVGLDAAGNVYVGATSFGFATNYDFTVLKYAPTGTLLWERHHSLDFDELHDIAVTDAGVVYAVGYSFEVGGGQSLVTIRYETDGTESWTQLDPIGSSSPGALRARVVVASDGSVVVGQTENDAFEVIVRESDGSLRWTNTFAGTPATAVQFDAIAVDAAMQVYVTGRRLAIPGGGLTAKFDALGSVVWDHTVGGAFGSTLGPSTLVLDSFGRPIATHMMETACGVFESRTVRYSTDGVLEWETEYTSPAIFCGSFEPRASAIAPDDSVWITGFGEHVDAADFFDCVTLRIREGTIEASTPFDFGSAVDVGRAVGVDATGRATVLADHQIGASIPRGTLLHYAPDGTLEWSFPLLPVGIVYRGTALAQRNGRIVTLAQDAINGQEDLLIDVFSLPNLTPFRRGDCGNDGMLDLSDAIAALSALFDPVGSADCPSACDANDDGGFDISDPISILAHLFSGGAAPSAPYPDCGVDPTPDALTCDASSCP